MKDKSINIRLDEYLYDAINQVATRHQIKRSEVVRLALEDKLSKYGRGANLSSDDLQALRALVIDVRNSVSKYDDGLYRVGNNLNQIAKHLNTSRNASDIRLYSMQLSDIEMLMIRIDNNLDAILKRLVVLDDF